MLQIISGKFFKSNNVISHAAKGVLYSNFSWVASVESNIATLEPIDTYGDVATYVISYINQIEKVEPPQKDILVRVGDSEIVNSFANLCSFYFMALFHIDKNHVVNSCRESSANYCDSCLPSKFFPNFFAKQVHGTAEQVAAFSVFVDKTLGLSRKNYESVMSSIRIFIESLSLVSGNIDLSYSSLVYALESLAQGYLPYSPCWDDFPKKDKIDKVLADIDGSTAFELRNILIQDANLKAQKRFLDFTCQHIDDSFFIAL